MYKQSSSTVKRLGLELGGNAAFLVFPTADLDLAVNIVHQIIGGETIYGTDLVIIVVKLFSGGWMYGQQIPQCRTNLRLHQQVLNPKNPIDVAKLPLF